MPRKQKHPEHKAEAERLMNELLDEVVAAWTTEEEPEIKTVAEETELSPAKIRKLLITAGERDKTTYYDSSTATQILLLYHQGKSAKEIQEVTGLSYTSVQGYLPYSKIIYSLNTVSTEAERICLYRMRRKVVSELQSHINLPDQSLYLWKTVIAFEGYPFKTSGRGKRGGVEFKYEVSRATGAGGRHYQGMSVDGYGNELWIIGADGEKKDKSISRSSVDLALKNALLVQAEEGCVSGPRKLGVPGVRSNLYAMFLRFGVITASREA